MTQVNESHSYYLVEKLSVIPGGLYERPGLLSYGDTQTMRDYARIIRTLQLQMDIPGTIFDDDIFDEEDERAIYGDL
jgi:hypothetical protein